MVVKCVMTKDYIRVQVNNGFSPFYTKAIINSGGDERYQGTGNTG